MIDLPIFPNEFNEFSEYGSPHLYIAIDEVAKG
jgi:hypothetical protein